MDIDALFESFAFASELPKILQLFDQICAVLEIDQTDASRVYDSLKSGIRSWRAVKLWTHLDKRAELKEYCLQKACNNLAVLIIGAGFYLLTFSSNWLFLCPCGLRAAIECALLGAHVVLVEQRESFSRNNVLHIWPFVIQDLKDLGIKVFYPKFCRGSIDHISIRQLQCALLKVCLVLGVQFYNCVTFQELLFPETDSNKKVLGWRASFEPSPHLLSSYVFDVLIGADGKRNTVPGFPKREMRGKLAIGITANFVNRGTVAEEKVQEIRQKFFNDMKMATNVDLENIVYYKDETHYFVMCAKKQSLLDKGVIIKDYEEVTLLLAPENIDQENLCHYAREAAKFATNGKLPEMTFARSHNGKEDVAVFDFTSLYSAQCSVRLLERLGRRLLISIVGDSLHEPFWPTGSGCARGFLGVFDTAWMLRSYGLKDRGVMTLIAERESIYRLLAQTKPDNLRKQIQNYTIDPWTRYLSLETNVQPFEVCDLVDTDNPRNIDANDFFDLRVDDGDELLNAVFLKRCKLIKFCQQALQAYRLKVHNFDDCWEDGRALAALLAKFRPELINYIEICLETVRDRVFRRIITVVEKEYGIACNFASAVEWAEIGTNERVDFIESLVSKLKADTKRMNEMLLNSFRALSSVPKQKSINSFEAKMSVMNELGKKKLRPVARTTSVGDVEEDQLLLDFLNDQQDDLDEQQVRGILAELNDQRSSEGPFRSLGTRNVDFIDFDKLNRKIAYGSIAAEHYTKRPVVDKLNFERLCLANKIITGEVEAEKIRELYSRKRRSARMLACKLDKKYIIEMEEKLEKTALGLLIDKDQFKPITSKEEKIMSANAAAARQVAQEGFKKEAEKFKDVDEKLLKADLLLKNNNLAGVNTVTRMRQQNALIFANPHVSAPISKPGRPPKPMPLPKKIFLPEQPTEQVDPNISKLGSNKPVVCQQQICQLCNKQVYLAERMQVEGIFIHKRCFRCAFCGRPLRIGHCGQDRDLEKYNPRFFCMQHLKTSLKEKIDQLQKLNPDACERAEAINSVPSRTNSETEDSAFAANMHRNGGNTELKPSLPYVTAPNTPSVIVEKTLKKFLPGQTSIDQKADSKIKSSDSDAFGKKLQISLKPRPRPKLASSFSEERYLKSSEPVCEPGIPLHLPETSEESVSSSDEEFFEADLAELEKTVLENYEKNLDNNLSEAQALNLLQSFNERRCAKTVSKDLLRSKSLPFEEVFATPKENLLDVTSDKFYTPETTFETPTHAQTASLGETLPSMQIKGDNRNLQNQLFLSGGNGLLARLFNPESASRREKAKESYRNSDYCRAPYLDGQDKKQAHSALKRTITGNAANTSHSLLSFSRKNIRHIQKRAEQIVKEKERERVRTAQDLQRSLQETESRKAEVQSVGCDLEKRLSEDSQNRWVLEQWMLYVHEMEQLKRKEDNLLKRVEEIELTEAYKKLQHRLKSTQNAGNEDSEAEKDLLHQVIEVIEKRDKVREELDGLNRRSSIPEVSNFPNILEDNEYSYQKFSPYFLKT